MQTATFYLGAISFIIINSLNEHENATTYVKTQNDILQSTVTIIIVLSQFFGFILLIFTYKFTKIEKENSMLEDINFINKY